MFSAVLTACVSFWFHGTLLSEGFTLVDTLTHTGSSPAVMVGVRGTTQPRSSESMLYLRISGSTSAVSAEITSWWTPILEFEKCDMNVDSRKRALKQDLKSPVKTWLHHPWRLNALELLWPGYIRSPCIGCFPACLILHLLRCLGFSLSLGPEKLGVLLKQDGNKITVKWIWSGGLVLGCLTWMRADIGCMPECSFGCSTKCILDL